MQITDIFPTIPPVRHLIVTSPDFTGQGVDFWVWLRSLQGLVNRRNPELYIMQGGCGVRGYRHELYEKHWLDYYVKTFGITHETEDDLDRLIERYKDVAGGYVLYDNESVIQTQNLAITRAGLESLLPVSPDQEHWMKRHGIPKRDDLRGRFRNNWDAAEWAIDNLWPFCSKHIYANLCVHRPFWYAMIHTIEDFVVYYRAMALDLPLSRQSRRSLMLYRRMLDSAEAPGVQINWHCIRDQEKEYVAEAAERGFFNLCSIHTPNMTIHGGVGDHDASYAQKLPPKSKCRAAKNKIYCCFYVSDGDATWAMNDMHSGNWLDPARGEFKLGWGILPFTVKMMPGMLRYYHETKRPNDCFWGPSSGVGYTYSHLWPDGLAQMYLSETRRLLDQSGQNGCNMVNWFLRDWWREVEKDDAVLREQEALKSGPGLVCGLGGSPYAKSYPLGPIPKMHSVHIANVGNDNVGDILRFARECPARPAFMFLFAQISKGVLGQLAKEKAEFDKHPEIKVLSMDEFFLTLQDAVKRGMVKDPVYESTDALAETWLKAPGRHRLPLCERITMELADLCHAEPAERRRRLVEPGWIELVSREVEGVASDRESFLKSFKGIPSPQPDEEPDVMLYVAHTVAWTVARSSLEAQGIYGNGRHKCFEDFRRLCGSIVDTTPFDRINAAWDDWEKGAPAIEDMIAWCDALAAAAKVLRKKFGPEGDDDFKGWPPKAI
ncbi:MAG TPA: GxGYxYP family putative glycoside hydrolase [Candidatus Brocadiia bacterium]|nr:GxGYxYP family putative glycoside hydrolase [Candidatus Brocadiia bacterium]